MFPIGPWPLTDEQLTFAASLIDDLSLLGYRLQHEGNAIFFSRRIPKPKADPREFYRDAHVKLHRVRISPQADRIRTFEAEFGNHLFVDGANLDLGAIEPHLRSVDLRKRAHPSRRDQELVSYLRAYQTISSHMSVGRENAYILEDMGRTPPAVMGVLVLSSPRYYQPRRDEVLGWLSPSSLKTMSERRRTQHERIRMAGLNRIMQVAVCCALPPYSHLGAARLLAIAPFMKLVRDDFAERWYDRRRNPKPDLVAVTTTTSMGMTGTPFQSLRAGKFMNIRNARLRGENWNRDGVIYARLGTTHPWKPKMTLTTKELFADFGDLISEATRAQAVTLVQNRVGGSDAGGELQQAMLQIGITADIFRAHPIGFFLGALDLPSVEALSTGDPRTKRPQLNWNIAVQQFRSDFGEADCPTKMPGLSPVARASAIERRRTRARSVTLSDIVLSRLLTHADPAGRSITSEAGSTAAGEDAWNLEDEG
jgi:hypothetical protein